MESYFYFYTVVGAIELAVHLIVNWQQLAGLHADRSRVGAREFRLFLASLAAFFLSDLLWGLFAGLTCPRLLYADTVFYFLVMAMSICAWARYVVAYLEMGGRSRTCMLWIGHGVLVFFVVALAANGFTDSFFTIDEQCVFTSGPLRRFSFLLLIAFNAVCAFLTLRKLRHTKGVLRRRTKVVLSLSLTMMLAIVLQMGHPLLPLYALGCLLGGCLLHVFVVEDERDELHRKELLARDYAAQLEAEREANKAKSLFFSTVSHDIRTPLNAIIGFSDLLERGVGDAGERERYLSTIRSSGKVLARLVDDVLDLSKMESGKLEIIEEPTNVAALVHEVISACEVARARKSLALKSDIGEVPWLSLDPQRIRQILFNLLSNAYKYTERGTVTVRVAWQEATGTLTLAVADTGKGISKEDLKRILQPFVQVADKNHRDGTGLGLSICNKLAKLMGGELTIESEVGVGSTFTITLPHVRVVQPLHPQAPTKPETRDRRTSPTRVLVVDDSPVNRAVLKAMLAKSGVSDVAMAADGREAFDLLKRDPHFDLVLSDLWMPVMDGCELVHAIRSDATLAHLPVYLVTADVEARKQAGSDAFTGIFLKPITLDRLLTLFT